MHILSLEKNIYKAISGKAMGLLESKRGMWSLWQIVLLSLLIIGIIAFIYIMVDKIGGIFNV